MNVFRACAVVSIGLLAAGCGGDEGDDTSAESVPAPSNLSLIEQGGGAMLTWSDNSTNEEHFMVMRKVGEERFATIATPTTPEYLDTDVVSGTTYVYHVMAMAGTDLSAASNEVTFTAP